MGDIIITTTDKIDGQRIQEYKGLVSFRGWAFDPGVAMSDAKGKRAEEYRALLQQAEDGLRAEAKLKGANAVVGVKVEMRVSPMVNLYLTGTAVFVG